MRAVQDMADELKIKNIQTMHGRFEDIGHHPQFRSQFDVVVARAVAPWPVLLEYALPFVKQGGVFIAYQGPEILSEVGENTSGVEKKLGGRIGRIEKTKLGDATRVFIEVNKVSPLSNRYPRDNGVPKKEPLS
ncbi:UNVERIFIED_CONTAM: hypothetical protein GTU68_001386 [Idotea baltica]|nr:hypothetical protein [Idotea baltica]